MLKNLNGSLNRIEGKIERKIKGQVWYILAKMPPLLQSFQC